MTGSHLRSQRLLGRNGEATELHNDIIDCPGLTRGVSLASPPTPPRQRHRSSFNSPSGVAKSSDNCSAVRLHIYHCDAITGYLNKVFLDHAEMPICHVGVDVHDREWTFQFFQNTWSETNKISGVQSCSPTQAEGYEYIHSLDLGYTSLTEDEVISIINELRRSWLASSYHITKNNCIHFAEALVVRLRVPCDFPSRLKAIIAVARSPATDAIVDHAWGLSKWWMIKTQDQIESADDVRSDNTLDVATVPKSHSGCSNLFDMMQLLSCTSVVRANA